MFKFVLRVCVTLTRLSEPHIRTKRLSYLQTQCRRQHKQIIPFESRSITFIIFMSYLYNYNAVQRVLGIGGHSCLRPFDYTDIPRAATDNNVCRRIVCLGNKSYYNFHTLCFAKCLPVYLSSNATLWIGFQIGITEDFVSVNKFFYG